MSLGGAEREDGSKAKKKNVLILDGHRPPALTVSRSLARSGYNVDLATPWYRRSSNLFSRYLRNRISYVPHQEDPEAFRRFTRRMSYIYDVILPVAEDTELEISHFRHDINSYCLVPIPDGESLRVACDKGLTVRLAEGLGIPTPLTISAENEDELVGRLDEVRYPAVVKLPEESGARVFPRYRIARDKVELLAAYRYLARCNVAPLVQEYVQGEGLGAFLLYNKYSELIACFTHRRIIEYPISGGFSAFAESILDPEALEISIKLLGSLNWKGVAMVEFKRMSDGSLRLMEINPRFWGSISLAVFSGVDFPTMLVETFDGRRSELSFPSYSRRYMIRASVLAKSIAQSVSEGKVGQEARKLLNALSEPGLVRFEDVNSDIGPLFSQVYYNAFDHAATTLAKVKKKVYLRLNRPNFDYLTPSVAVGGENGAKVLARAGFQTIIDLREHATESEQMAARFHSIEHLTFPTPDNGAPSESELKRIIDQVSRGVESGKKVLIHCSEGRGRAPTVACAYLMSTGLGFSESCRILKSKRSLVNFTDAQLAALESFSRALKENVESCKMDQMASKTKAEVEATTSPR